MSRATKIWLITAASLVLIGCAVFGGVMTVLKWDFTKLSTGKYETNKYEINESFGSISIDTDTADINFVPSDNGKCSVVCYEQENLKHTVSVNDGTLVIKVNDTRKWYEHIGINFGSPKITVYIPQGEYGRLLVKSDTGDVTIPADFKFEDIDISESTGDVKNYASASDSIKIKTSTGKVFVESISCGSLDISVTTGNVTASGISCDGEVKVKVSTGDTKLTDVFCKNLTSSGSTGNISLVNVIASAKLSIERSTGKVNFDRCDAAEIFVETDTGDVKGSLLSEKVFDITTDTGKKDVPKTSTGGRCEIHTDTGDIMISIR